VIRLICLSVIVASAIAGEAPVAPVSPTAPPPTPAESAPGTPLTLAEAVAQAARTAGVRTAEAGVVERRALQNAARADLIADTAGVGRYQRRDDYVGDTFARENPRNDLDARLTLSQPLVDLAAWRRLAAARGDRRAAEAERAVARETAASDVASAYVRLARAELVVAARDADRTLASELTRLATAQTEAGIAERIVATRAATRQATAEGAWIEARQERAQAHIALARVLERDRQGRMQPTTPLDERFADLSLPSDVDAATAQALAGRPEISSAAFQVDAAEARRRAATALYTPTVDLDADFGRAGSDFDDTETVWSIGAVLVVPLPVDGSVAAERDAAAARLTQARIVLEDARRAIAAEVADAAAGLTAGEARLAIAVSRLDLAEQEVTLARARFEAGATDNLALVEAQLSLGAARTTEVDARATIADSRIRLARALGQAINLR